MIDKYCISAFFFYIDGVLTIIVSAWNVATETFGFAFNETIILFLVVQIPLLIDLAVDGRAGVVVRAVAGEELLIAMEDDAKRRFDHALDATGLKGLPYQVRFHLHPDVEAQLDMGGVAVSLALKSGELWVFRHDGKGELRLEPSVFLEKNRLKPRATTQIVLSSRALEHANRIRWSLSKAQDTPISIRDLNRDGMDVAF